MPPTITLEVQKVAEKEYYYEGNGESLKGKVYLYLKRLFDILIALMHIHSVALNFWNVDV